MIAAGEAGGILDIILQRLSTYIEKSVRRSQVRTAMMYPAAVISIAILVVWVILWKVIPVFAQLFAGVGAELPFLTLVVIAASNFVGRYSIFIIALIIAGGMALNRWHKTYRGRRVIDAFMLRLPVLGQLLLKIAVARFCRTLSTPTSSACRSSRASRSRRAPRATPWSRTPSWPCARRSKRARPSASRWPRPRSSRPWWCR